MWHFIVEYSAQFIVDSLKFLTVNVTGNHGWSILLLTLIFRILILPLTMKSLKSMKAMQALQPKMKELQEKYKDDKEKQTRELMALYKEHGANPVSGCLPMILQIPIFILLFTVLRYPEKNGFMLVNSSFYGMDLTTAAVTHLRDMRTYLSGLTLALPGMVDLTSTNIGYFKDTYLYLPTLPLVILMLATTFLQQAGMTMDPKQKPMMYMMNIFIVFISLTMPSGVLLYWVFSNMFQVVQQKFTGAGTPAPAPAGAPAKKGASGGAGKKVSKSASADSTETMKQIAEAELAQTTTAVEKEKQRSTTASSEKELEKKFSPPTGSLKKHSMPKKPQSSSKKGKKKKR